jgi:hypothetical protein
MKNSLKRALRIYKWLSLAFIVLYWIYAFVDDYPLIQRYWRTAWLDYVEVWAIWLPFFFLLFSFAYWFVAIIFSGVGYLLDKVEK